MMDAYEKAVCGYMQRCREEMRIIDAKIKFIDYVWDLYEAGLLTRAEWRELFDMAR